MAFCRCCGKEIHETAISCPGCGGAQSSATARSAAPEQAPGDGPIWVPIASLIFGIMVLLASFDDSKWDVESAVGAFLAILLAIVFGSLTLAKQSNGRGMAIAGIVTASIGMILMLASLK